MSGQVRSWSFETTHLCYVQQVDLQKKAQGASCDLVRCSADGIADLVADGQPVPMLMLGKQQGKRTEKKKTVNQVKLLTTLTLNAEVILRIQHEPTSGESVLNAKYLQLSANVSRLQQSLALTVIGGVNSAESLTAA